MFEKNLQDIVKGIRSCRDDTEKQQYVIKVTTEIKEEISKVDMEKKANGLLKLLYLNMLGYEMDWAVYYKIYYFLFVIGF